MTFLRKHPRQSQWLFQESRHVASHLFFIFILYLYNTCSIISRNLLVLLFFLFLQLKYCTSLYIIQYIHIFLITSNIYILFHSKFKLDLNWICSFLVPLVPWLHHLVFPLVSLFEIAGLPNNFDPPPRSSSFRLYPHSHLSLNTLLLSQPSLEAIFVFSICHLRVVPFFRFTNCCHTCIGFFHFGFQWPLGS